MSNKINQAYAMIQIIRKFLGRYMINSKINCKLIDSHISYC